MAKSFREDIRNQMFKDISQYSSKDPDASSYQPQAYSDALKISNEIGLRSQKTHENQKNNNKYSRMIQNRDDNDI